MWNFVGRQNDIHSPSPGEIWYGNWESGIGFIDKARLGDQDEAPDALKHNKGKNHYFFLPLILGLIGLFFQFDKDKRGCWLVFLLFFMTGIAIVVYLNQPPYQVRERDYAYAGSFYAFAIWIGFAVAALYDILEKSLKGKYTVATAAAVTIACLGVPALMAQQNWDDHDRSNRFTSVEMATNYLNSVGQNGILITHGDNDTFPLWYAQEVESIRPDVRICNTSLLGTDWYIGQMKYKINDSDALPLRVSEEQYLYGTNDFVRIFDSRDQVIPIEDVMAIFRHPDAKAPLEDGSKVDYIVSRKISVPVNKENALKSGIVPEIFADLIQDEIILEIPKGKNYLTKPELFMLDLLSSYQWDRPINVLSQGGDINIGIKKYLIYEGFSSKFVPFENSITSKSLGFADGDALYDKMMNTYKWDALKRTDYFVDYQNFYTFLGVLPQREIFYNVADILMREGKNDKAVEILDKCQECVPDVTYPLESSVLGFFHNDVIVIRMAEMYFQLGANDKASDLAMRMGRALMQSIRFYLSQMGYGNSEFDYCCNYYMYLIEVLKENGDDAGAKALQDDLNQLLGQALGNDSFEDGYYDDENV